MPARPAGEPARSSSRRSGPNRNDTRRLARHVGAAMRPVEEALQTGLARVVDPVWAEIGGDGPPPRLLRTAFDGYGADEYTLLGAYDHLAHAIRLNIRALAVGALLRRHAPDGDACWTEPGMRLHPAAVLEPLAMPLVHELVHGATWREDGPPGDGPTRIPARVRWPLYEQALVEVDGRVVGSLVDPRRRALLEGITDARAAQVLTAVSAEVPAWLREPAPDALRAAHPSPEHATYGARAAVELLFTPDEIAGLLTGPASWTEICDRAVGRMPADEALVARGWLSGDLDRFAGEMGLEAEHPFRRIGWRSLAAWIRLGDTRVDSAA